jgi:hypothetical protein
MGCPMRLLPRPTLLLAVLAGLLIAAPSALADSALEQYQRNGTINPCTATGPGGVPNDVEQYAPDFLEALKDAQRRGCNRGGSSTTPTETKNGVPVVKGGGTLPPGSTFVPKPPVPPRTTLFRDDKVVQHHPLASGAEVSTPAPVIILAIMVLVALAGAALAATFRHMGWGGGSGPVRHAFGEAGYRLRGLTKRA